MPLTPQLLWAQRSDRLYITIDLQDCKDPTVELDSDEQHGKLTFRGHAHSHATGALAGPLWDVSAAVRMAVGR